MNHFRIICSWCTKDLGGNQEATEISHGICEACLEKYFPCEAKASEADHEIPQNVAY